MKHIILESENTEASVFNVADLETRLNQLPDPRHKRGKIYPLGMILTMVLLARLSGEDKPSEKALWIRLRCESIVKLFDFKHQRMPCLNTLHSVLQHVVSLAELETIFSQYLHETYGRQQSVLIVFDGKTMRGTIPKGSQQGVHVLVAYLPMEGVVLKQIEVVDKENEISAAPQLIREIDVKNRVVCADAMHTRRPLSADILAGGGDYIWFVKENQPRLLADVDQYIKPAQPRAGWHLLELLQTVAKKTDKGHGRLEKSILTLMVDEQQFLDWPGVCLVFKLERYVKEIRTGKESIEVVYGISSYDPVMVTAEQMLEWTRLYWGIEIGLHR